MTDACAQSIGALLLQAGTITPNDLAAAVSARGQSDKRIGQHLIRAGALTESALLAALSRQLEIPTQTLDAAPDVATQLRPAIQRSGYPLSWWRDQDALPVLDPDGGITCIAADPLAPGLADFLDLAFAPAPVRWRLAPSSLIDQLSLALAPTPTSRTQTTTDEEGPAIRWLDELIGQAAALDATDIHFEPDDHSGQVRLRLDGVLHPWRDASRDLFDPVVARLKLLAGLDIAERRLPQDGRLTLRAAGRDLDARVATLPGRAGESMVLRLLPVEAGPPQLNSLGMSEDMRARWLALASQPNGVVLVTGPTGSGKSTTLHASLVHLNDGRSRIVTIEEPVERRIPGINQVQANSAIGYGFAEALRAILRQDPDRIMVGEIRDADTAGTALQAALTGHMVYSTLHTNDAAGAFGRLVDLGVEPFLIASSVRGVLAQRLLRRLCPACALPDVTLPKRAVGCPSCGGSGYRGRFGVFDLIEATPALHDAILARASPAALADLAATGGLRADAEAKRLLGWTDRAELDRVLGA